MINKIKTDVREFFFIKSFSLSDIFVMFAIIGISDLFPGLLLQFVIVILLAVFVYPVATRWLDNTFNTPEEKE